MNNTVHFMLQPKGGIGKSFSISLLAQYFQTKEQVQLCGFDTDQENTTFAQYAALGVEHVPVLDDARQVNAKKFDALTEKMLVWQGVSVVDTGANSFSPLLAYLFENDVIDLLRDNGKKVYIHTIVGGGDTLSDTASGFNLIATDLNAPIVLWQNEFFGELRTTEGKPFTETKVYKMHSAKLAGIVLLHKRNSTTFGDDIRRMTARRLTVAEIMGNPDFTFMEKQRMATFSRDVYAQLDQINW